MIKHLWSKQISFRWDYVTEFSQEEKHKGSNSIFWRYFWQTSQEAEAIITQYQPVIELVCILYFFIENNPLRQLFWHHYSSGLSNSQGLETFKLTVRTSVGLQSKSDAPVVAPLQRDQADIASDHRTLELVLDHAVGVAVTWKRLEITSAAESAGFPTTPSENLSFFWLWEPSKI